jgi:hypothetical protein
MIEDGTPRAESINLGGRQSNATCVLWRKPAETDEHIWLYGDEALEEWLLSTSEEHRAYHFSASFKPDILKLDRARKDTWAFLYKAYLEMRERRTPGNIGKEEGVPVVVGVPAEIGDEQKDLTAQIARDAGFGAVECIPEPIGALAYHLAHGQISDDEALEGVIVVDFGGGTLDIALVDKEGVQEPWGEPFLGGRLFDDLFYQWVVEKNPKLNLRGFSQDDLMSGWFCGCRKLKEDFSRHWKRQGGDFSGFRGGVALASGETLGRLQNCSLAEFYERARNYRPSELARRYFREVGGELSRLGEQKPVDLLEMIRSTLSGNGKIDQLGRKFSLVVLTGGSSSWPFMQKLASEVFGVPDNRIISSASPEVTIGQGLAIYNVIRYRNHTKKLQIEAQKSEQTQALNKKIDKKLKTFADDVSEAVASRLMADIAPIYLDWYRKGGTLLDVEQRANAVCKKFDAERQVTKRFSKLTEEIRTTTLDFVSGWLKELGISPRADQLCVVLSGTSVTKSGMQLNFSESVGEAVAESFTGALAGIMGVIGGMIAGGGGTALIISGPLGWLIGAGVAIAAVVGLHGDIKAKLKVWDFKGLSLGVLHQVLSENELKQKLDHVESTLRTSLSAKIAKDIKASKDQLVDYLNQTIDVVSKKFSLLEPLSPRR